MNDNAITHDVLNQGTLIILSSYRSGLLQADEAELVSMFRFDEVRLILPRLLSLLNSKEPAYVEVAETKLWTSE
jgi:hypothetical protein